LFFAEKALPMPLDTLVLDTIASDCTYGLETPDMDRAIIDLTDRAFGPGRYVKTAERLREGSKPLPRLSFVAHKGKVLAGSVRLWPIVVTENEIAQPAVFLGPIVVDETFRGQGIGRTLISMALEAADKAGVAAVILVGAQAYFAPFGFARADGLTLPGPVDPKRLLIRYAKPGASLRGQVSQGV
jgi:predicted N-acetyltransferase YhbS